MVLKTTRCADKPGWSLEASTHSFVQLFSCAPMRHQCCVPYEESLDLKPPEQPAPQAGCYTPPPHDPPYTPSPMCCNVSSKAHLLEVLAAHTPLIEHAGAECHQLLKHQLLDEGRVSHQAADKATGPLQAATGWNRSSAQNRGAVRTCTCRK